MDGNIKEVRPGEEFTYPKIIESRFVVLQEGKSIPKKKKTEKPRKKKEISSPFLENSDGSSSTQS